MFVFICEERRLFYFLPSIGLASCQHPPLLDYV